MTGPVQRLDGAILFQGSGLDDIAKCVLTQIREVQRNGCSIEPYAQLLRTIHDARMSPARHGFGICVVAEQHSESQDGDDWMSAKQVAQLLGVTTRQVQRLAFKLRGVRVGNTWAFRRAPVLALAAERKRNV